MKKIVDYFIAFMIGSIGISFGFIIVDAVSPREVFGAAEFVIAGFISMVAILLLSLIYVTVKEWLRN